MITSIKNFKNIKESTTNESVLLLIEEGFVDNIYIRDLDENDQEIMVNDMVELLVAKPWRGAITDEQYNELKNKLYDISFDLNTLSVNNDNIITDIADDLFISNEQLISYLNEIISKNKSMFLYDESILNEDLSGGDSSTKNSYSVDQRDRKQEIVAILESAKSKINTTEQETFYNQLEETNEKMILNLLKEFDDKSIAIDDKILSLSDIENIDYSTYQEKKKNAQEVVDAVSLMKEALLDVHKNVTNDTLIGEGVEFDYMLLNRLKQDCEYYLGNGRGSERQLHQGSVEEQISKMKELWNGLSEKPEWLSMEQIEKYESDMLQMKSENTNEGVGSWLKIWNTVKSFFANFKSASKTVDIALSNI